MAKYGRRPIGVMRCNLRLNPAFRFGVYAAVVALFVTGIVWLVADQLKNSSDNDVWQQITANALMLHGAAAMLMLMLLGALFPLHIPRGWRARRNRILGAFMFVVNALLVVTAFGLYYAGSEALRPWMSDIHISAGISLPALLVLHVWRGRSLRKEI
jgi:cytochrome b561